MFDKHRHTGASNDAVKSEHANEIAMKALQYLASEGELFSRFVALTGIDAGQMREAAGEQGFLSGVLDFFLAHEPSLIAFAEAQNIDPEDVAKARVALDHNKIRPDHTL